MGIHDENALGVLTVVSVIFSRLFGGANLFMELSLFVMSFMFRCSSLIVWKYVA